MPAEEFMEKIIMWYIIKSYGWIIDKYGEFDYVIKYHYNYVNIKLKGDVVMKIYDLKNPIHGNINRKHNSGFNNQVLCVSELTKRGIDISHRIVDYQEDQDLKWIVFEFIPGTPLSEVQETPEITDQVREKGWWGTTLSSNSVRDASLVGLNTIYDFYAKHCQEVTGFYINGNIIGASFVGQMVQNHAFAELVVKKVMEDVKTNGIKSSVILERCDVGDPAKTFGLILDTVGNLNGLRVSVKSWSQGYCERVQYTQNVPDSTMWFVSWPGKGGNASPDPNVGACRYVITPPNISGGFGKLCGGGVTDDAVTLYNPSVDLNNALPGQPVCCSVGDLPDLRPKPNSDGSCYVHEVVSGDSCSSIMAKYYPLSSDDLDRFNKNTYGWYGCNANHLWVGDKVCVSSGTPPRPNPNPEAECGPLAPGDKYLSECPLKACCSSDGFCGLDQDHCATKDSPTGAPGTHGCESNCDLVYVQGDPPAEFKKIGYYESWSVEWPCMNGSFPSIDWSPYSHIHFSFADIDDNLQVSMSGTAASEFENFLWLFKKKVVSFGGWGISTDVSTYTHLRNAMLPSNVDTTVANLVKFAEDNGLDGLDIDWEYPGAPDIPGIPPGLASDGPNYLEFLKKLRAALPSDKSLSIAAPASYWYLKSFPIAEMAQYLDYIVYMTYDLHGQWDYGNKWTGPYLKSHVNLTETKDTLALITHAGVPSNKILLGLGAYGRSFQQVDPSCSGPSCKFTGPASGATPGTCTNTAGYISLTEINDIVSSGSVRQQYYDEVADCDILLYGSDQWVAWTTEVTMEGRTSWAQSINLGGTVVWAADLLQDLEPEDPEISEAEFSFDSGACDFEIRLINDIDVALATRDDEDFWSYLSCKGITPPSAFCRSHATARSMSSMLSESLQEYDYLVSNDYQTIFTDYFQPQIYDKAIMAYNLLMLNITSPPSEVRYEVPDFGLFDVGEPQVSLIVTYNTTSTSLAPDSISKRENYFDFLGFNKYLGYASYEGSSTLGDVSFSGVYLKDQDSLLKDLSESTGINITIDLFRFGYYEVNGDLVFGSFCSDGCVLSFDNYPILDKDLLIPNPMESIKSNLTEIVDFSDNLRKATTSWEDYPENIVVGAKYPFISIVSGLESMFNAYNSGVLTMFNFEYFIQGIFPADLELGEEDYKIVEYSTIKYPEALEYFIKAKVYSGGGFAEDLARIVHQHKPPLNSEHELVITIPIDCLPVPPKHIVESLSGSWDFFKTAWAILGDYDIPNLNIYRDHRELAYRNNKPWEHLKINAYQDNGDAMIRLGEREVLDDPRLERVFEMFWDDRYECPPEVLRSDSFVDWNRSLHNIRTPRPSMDLSSEFMPKVPIHRTYNVPERPWQKIFYRTPDQEYLTPEIREWLEIGDEPYPRTDVLDKEVLGGALSKNHDDINTLLKRAFSEEPESLSLLEKNVLLIIAVMYDDVLSQDQISKIQEKYGDSQEFWTEKVLEDRDDIQESSEDFNVYSVNSVLKDDDTMSFMVSEHYAREYGMRLHKDFPVKPDFFIKDLEKFGCLAEEEDSVIAKIWNYHNDKLAAIFTKK
ncbi:hypothetical protein IWW36_002308 [Coemansia brasiliensis]|uniref:Chitinase n=1 Tax=Coemansia brasiliensis TaxID=2650707 RepID=A0A9W8M0S1_9FUNG|nr:hypothetical protein IWW36_002308 [Coemansia brasiliensis]